MPTILPRYQVTETAELAAALDLAGENWPNESRSKLLLRIIHAGEAAVRDGPVSAAEARRTAIYRASGTFQSAYGPGYLEHLRANWPG